MQTQTHKPILGFFEAPKGSASASLKEYAALGGIGPSSPSAAAGAAVGASAAPASCALASAGLEAVGGRLEAVAERVTGFRAAGLEAASISHFKSQCFEQQRMGRGVLQHMCQTLTCLCVRICRCSCSSSTVCTTSIGCHHHWSVQRHFRFFGSEWICVLCTEVVRRFGWNWAVCLRRWCVG
jgi:hypothetical protein